jgi:hypothetical protein
MRSNTLLRAGAVLIGTAFFALVADAQQPRVTSPMQQFGRNFGDDYFLATYTQIAEYWRKLDAESDRMTLIDIGETAEGRRHLGAIVTSPENHRNLARYKDIARRLALAEGVTEAEARQLAKEGKAVVWIDGGLHASEVLGAQQLGETLYQMVSRTDDETMRFLNDVIIVFVHANPDGNELYARYYMRNPVDSLRSSGGVPRRYQKYIDHDNNRDFFASTQKETENMNRLMYREWYPQIMYNHHQTGPAGTVMFAPPFRDPANYNFDPLIVMGIDQVGSAMHARFIAENKPGVIMRSGASYSTWWNGGLRTTAYFHNMIGILTETIGNPTPTQIPFNASRQLRTADYPFPIQPQRWHFRQSVDYSVTANRAILDFASTQRENVLFRIWRMGMNSIERGSRDHWTLSPRDFARAGLAIGRGGGGGGRGGGGGGGRGGGGGGGGGAVPGAPEAPTGMALLQRPETRDPRGFIVPSNQPDFPTATKFVNALLENGVAVHRAPQQFTVQGKTYPAGSLVVKAAQAFRPHVMDMFEPQDHPDDFNPASGRPIPPYDIAGWTLAYQMGVQFDRIMEGFDVPGLEKVNDWNLPMPPGRVTTAAQAPAGWVTSHQVNNAFIALNRLMNANEEAYWLMAPATAGTSTLPAGSLYIPRKATTQAALQDIAQKYGVSFDAVATAPRGDALKLKKLRIALLDDGRSMPAGWATWIMEQFEFPITTVYAPNLDEGNLNEKWDVILLPSGLWGVGGAGGGGRGGGGGGGRGGPPAAAGVAGAGAGGAAGGAGAAAGGAGAGRVGGGGGGGGGRGGGGRGGGGAMNVFPEDAHILRGSVSAAVTLPAVRSFIENGGTVIAIGNSARSLSAALELPVRDHLMRGTVSLADSIYAPGSVLQAAVNTGHPLAHGVPERVDLFFDDSPTFAFQPNAEAQGLTKIMWFDTDAPLRSGWAWGQQHLKDGVAAFEARIGRGRAFMFGPEVLFRAQPHGTFKFVFNGLYLASGTPSRM